MFTINSSGPSRPLKRGVIIFFFNMSFSNIHVTLSLQKLKDEIRNKGYQLEEMFGVDNPYMTMIQ